MASRIPKPILFLAWLAALMMLAGISRHHTLETTQFTGIADDQEQTIRFALPVEIVRYAFVAGQTVDAGDLIVEVRQPDFEAQRQILQEKIHALKFGDRESRATMQAEIVRLQADLAARLSELDSQIRALSARQDAAKTFFEGLDSQTAYAPNTQLQQQIDGLNLQRRALRQANAARSGDLKARLGTPERAVDAQIAELEKQMQDVERQNADLKVHARFAGRVSSVLFKVGETVPPYQPVLTLHGAQPAFINGYIHETVVNDVKVAQTVWVQSSTEAQKDRWIEGEVQGLGSRIVAFPERLKVNPLAQAWGREVVIQLKGDHGLLLGEKVNVNLTRPNTLITDLKAQLAALVP